MVYTPNPPRFRNVQTELDISTFPAGASFLVFSLWAYSNSAEFAILINDTTASASGNLIFFQVDCGSGNENVAVTVKSGANIGVTGNNLILNGEITAAVDTLRTDAADKAEQGEHRWLRSCCSTTCRD